MPKDHEAFQQIIFSFLEEGSTDGLRRSLQEVHPADIAEIFPALNLAQRVKLLRVMDPERASLVLFELDREMLPALIEGLGFNRTADILDAMSTDDAADLLGDLPGGIKQKLLGLMEIQEAEDVAELLEYAEDTAGGIMTTEFVAIHQDITAERAIQLLREIAPDAETVYYVYVVNRQTQLVGVISLRELILAAPAMLIEEIMRKKVISVNVNTDQEEVAKLVAKYDFLAVPVVNDSNELLGIITIDDVLDVIEEEATEDMMRMAANIDVDDQGPDAGALRRASRRLPWLIGLLFGELIAGHVIEGFSGTLQHMTALAFFMTALAGGTGNAATQSLTVVVRGIATGEVNPRQVLKVVWGEAQVGLFIGLASGLVLAGFALLWQDSIFLGLVVGASLALSITVSTVLGSLVPVIINRFGIDPALASGPFIATLMDVTSMFIYFSLATLVLVR